MAINDVQPVLRMFLHPEHDLSIDVPLRKLPQRGLGERGLPAGNTGGRLAIGIEEMPSRAQHARHFIKETGLVRVVIRGFDIDHRIEGLVGEGQILGVALDEIAAGQPVSFWQNAIQVGFRSSPV